MRYGLGSGVAKACTICEPEVSTWRSMGLCDLGSGIGTRQTPQLQTEWCPQHCMTQLSQQRELRQGYQQLSGSHLLPVLCQQHEGILHPKVLPVDERQRPVA